MTADPDGDTAAADLLAAVRVFDLSMERYRAAFAHAYGITVNDSLVLSLLATAGSALKPADLARQLSVTAATLTNMLDRLEAAGFVDRARNAKDRRNLLVQLTAAGRSTLRTSQRLLQTAISGAVTAPDRAEFAAGLTRLAGALDTVTASPAMADKRVRRRSAAGGER